MTLSRRMKHRLVALSASLTVLVAGMVWGLHRLRRDVGLAFEEYQESRLLERAENRVAYAQILLAAPSPTMDVVSEKLDQAIELLDEFRAFQHSQSGAGEAHELDESTATNVAYDALSGVRATLRRDHRLLDEAVAPRAIAQLRESIKVALRSLGHTVKTIDTTMVRTRRTADVTMQSSIVIIVALSVAIGAAAAVMSVWQYRNVILPVRRLRDSAQRLASGRFTERVPVSGDDEFAEVEREFNAMAAELDELYRDLEEKVRAKSKELVRSERLISVGFLAAGVAHEINNPLNIITGHAELALARLGKSTTGDPEATTKTLGIIRDEAFRCKEIIEQLLSLTRTTQKHHGVLSVARIAADVQSLVAGLRQFHERRLDVHCEESKDLSVSGNGSELKQVLLNLTVNALEAVEPGVGEVRIDGRRIDGWVELSVTDNGRGMTPEVIEHVFEPFFTERKGSGGRGVGLGLSITHAIVDAHGGHIRAESDGPTRGSRFVVRLPAVGAAAS